MTNRNSSFNGGQKNGGPFRIGGQASNSGGPPFFFEIFFFFFQVYQVKPNFFLPKTSTLLPTQKFEIFISKPRNDFYTMLQNLNKNGQKRTRKINFENKRWTLSQETYLKMIFNVFLQFPFLNSIKLIRSPKCQQFLR